mgnify:CR=1 FL=1
MQEPERTPAREPPQRPVLVAHDGWLEVRLSVERTCAGNREGCVQLLAPIVRQHGVDRLLVVCTDSVDTIDRIEAYWTGEAIARLLSGVRIAIAVTRRSVDYLEDFAAGIARERGGDVRYFNDLDAAKRWLLAS